MPGRQHMVIIYETTKDIDNRHVVAVDTAAAAVAAIAVVVAWAYLY